MALTRKDLKTLTVYGREGIILNLRKVERAIRARVIKETLRTGKEALGFAKNVCPVDTGRMRRSLTGEPLPSGLLYKLYYEPSHFERDGVTYYPVYVERGTRRMPARPVLQWTKHRFDPIHKQRVADVLRKETS
jgi:hypothetical protein